MFATFSMCVCFPFVCARLYLCRGTHRALKYRCRLFCHLPILITCTCFCLLTHTGSFFLRNQQKHEYLNLSEEPFFSGYFLLGTSRFCYCILKGSISQKSFLSDPSSIIAFALLCLVSHSVITGLVHCSEIVYCCCYLVTMLLLCSCLCKIKPS